MGRSTLLKIQTPAVTAEPSIFSRWSSARWCWSFARASNDLHGSAPQEPTHQHPPRHACAVLAVGQK